MRKFLFVALVIVSVLTFSCDTVDTSFDEALPERYSLTTTVIPSGAGAVIPSEGNFVAGTSIAIEATPNEGYVFRNWDGDLTGNLNPRAVLFTGNRNVRAHFLFRDYPLNIEIVGIGTVEEEVISQIEQSRTESGTGTMLPVGGDNDAYSRRMLTTETSGDKSLKNPDGRINSEGGTQNSQSTVSETVQSTTVTVRLTAQPAEGWVFSRWEGDLTGSANPDTIVVDEEKNVTAVFVQDEPDMYVLSVQVDGEGSVDVDPEKDQYESGEEVVLTATAASGWRFTGWQGDLSGSTNPATMVMDSDKSVTAVFVQDEPDMYVLSVQVNGEGSVDVDPEKDQYESGEEVVLTATAASGWRFTGWQGDLSGSTNPATMVMDSDKNVTAVFVQDEPDMYTLSVQVDGQGSVGVNPEKDQYESGEEVVLTAAAASGWRFTGWQGALSGNTNPATLLMDSDKSVTAMFRRVGAPLMQIIQQPSETTAGEAISPAPAVQISNDLGSPISGADVSVRLNDNSFTTGSTNSATTNQDGVAVFNNLIIETAATDYRITFEADVQDAPDVQSGPFNILAAAPAAENSSADVPDGTSGEQTLILITVQDRFDNPVAGAGDQLQVIVSGANSTSPAVIETAVPGRYTAVYSPVASGTDQIAIQLSGNPISGSPYTSIVSANAPESVELISGNDQTGQVNRELDNPFVAKVVDQTGNPVAGVAVAFTITETPAGAIGQRMSNAAVTTDANGIASSLLTLGSLPGVYRVDASADGTGVVTFSARAEILAPSLITIVQQPAGTVAGSPVDPAPSVRVTDSENTPIEGIAITVSLNGGEFAAGSTTEILTGSDGISGFGNLIINTAASGYTLTFGSMVTDLAGVTSQSFNVTAASGDPSQSSAIVPDGVAGEETRITIRVEDAFGNPTGSADDLTVEVAGENEDGLTVTDTGTPGEFEATYTPETAGTDLITIRLDGVDISGSPYSSQVSAGTVDPSGSSVTADPDEVPVGGSSTVTIVLRDEFSNPVSGFTNADFDISLDGTATAGQISESTEPGTYQFEVTSDVAGQVQVKVAARGITLDDSPVINFVQEEESYTIGIHIQPENSKAGQPIQGPPSARITNQFGDPVAGRQVTVRERGGQSFASGTLIVSTGADGVAVFNNLVIDVTGRYQLEFSSNDAGAVNSRTFQVTP